MFRTVREQFLANLDPKHPLSLQELKGLGSAEAVGFTEGNWPLTTGSTGRAEVDCSHLVHTVYERAGFPYTYVSSSDLYTGVAEFHRVTRPQPGDLVVWPGHVGIVVNPSQNTFFSLLRSGFGVESYSSSYWKERGAPRFYRYVKEAAETNRRTKVRSSDFTHPASDISVNTDEISSIDTNPTNIELPRVQVIESAHEA